VVGSYQIDVYSRRIRYRMYIERNITILTGHSGSGKTELIRLISAYVENKASSGVNINCKKTCRVLTNDDWQSRLENMHDSIIFIDEGRDFVYTDEFARAVRHADNYFVIVTRDSIPSLPYSINAIIGFREEKNIFNEAKQIFNDQYNIYGSLAKTADGKISQIVTEDSNSGYEFFSQFCLSKKLACTSAHGKSNIRNMIGEIRESTLILVDGAAFGSEMPYVMNLVRRSRHCVLYAPESFEWLLLRSGILYGRLASGIEKADIERRLDDTAAYADSCVYMSWEQFYTDLLVSITHGDKYLEYSKTHLAPFYLTDNVIQKVISFIGAIA